MTEQEIREAVKFHYAGFCEYMRHVKGFMTVPSIEDICLWEIYKENKHMEDIQKEVHADYDVLVKVETGLPDD